MRNRAAFRSTSAALAVAGLLAVVSPPAGAGSWPPEAGPRSVIAVTESGGVNVLHSDFLTLDGEDIDLPDSVPAAHVVRLPRSGSFAERVARAEKGPLGNLESGTLYYISGTRLLVYMPHDADWFDLFSDMEHPTGTTSAAAGREHGTNPDALLVYVPASVDGWRWLQHQPWIDVVSASYYTVVSGQPRCAPNRFIRAIERGGRVVFTAAGNAEQGGIASSPSGAAGAYQVGGVDSHGRPYSPASSPSAITVGGTATRPYETGDRMEFLAAAHDALTGSQEFGGTSGAAPSTAGRGTILIEHARRLLRSSQTGLVAGTLARAARGAAVPERGPLADGDLTGAELTELLHDAAAPYTPPSPLRYLIEGYGALNEDVIERAKRVLAGRETLPQRPEDDEQHRQWERFREDTFQTACA